MPDPGPAFLRKPPEIEEVQITRTRFSRFQVVVRWQPHHEVSSSVYEVDAWPEVIDLLKLLPALVPKGTDDA